MKKIEVIKKDNKLQRLIIAPELKQELNNQKEIILEVEVEPQCLFCNNVKNSKISLYAIIVNKNYLILKKLQMNKKLKGLNIMMKYTGISRKVDELRENCYPCWN